jgi:ATP-binding cassette subfamily F protein 3
VAELDGLGRFNQYEGGYDRYLVQREERRVQLLARKSKQDREIAQMERFVERFRAKATKAKQAQSRIKALDKIERIEIEPEGRRRMRLRIPPPPRSGDRVLTLEGIHKRYDDKIVYQGIDFEVQRGDRVALAGPNGAGKSTLLRIAAGTLPFEAGDRVIGHNVSVVYFAQHQVETLQATRTVLEEMAADAQLDDIPRLRGQLGAFLFSGDDVDKKVSVLSGGEKARLALAKMLLRPANFLVLDEPTNHLDIEACEVLEQALGSFPGTIVFVSHDRSFINALATRVVEVEGGVLAEYLGDYDDFQRRKNERREANRPASQDASGKKEGKPSAVPPIHVSADAKPRLSKQERQAEREQQKATQRTLRRVERIESEILLLEERRQAAGWEMGAPEVASNPEALIALEAQRSLLQAQTDSLYREWERLADELAAIEDGNTAPKTGRSG